ncbi:rolling circle replication-associated protein [Macrococcus capreoli]|uniref:rolling circle replication-associated protein n=1 Tax=Macrococcus capreoli TaxID=2982690 RepID=UPI003F421C5D
MSREKMIFLEDENSIMELRKNMGGGQLDVYLTYVQLNYKKNNEKNDYNFKAKCYNNGVCKVFLYKNMRKKPDTFIHQKKSIKKMSEDEIEENKKHHIFEIKNLIKDYVLCNHFDHFWTLTFDPKKFHGEVSDDLAYEMMLKWLHSIRRKHKYKSDKQFNYILIPERHKSGQIHFHMITGNLEIDLIDSGKTYQKQKIYNCPVWEHGFSNVQRMRSKSKVSSYVTKYITKDLLYSPVRKHKKKYWCSKGLRLPKVYAANYADICDVIPLYDEHGALNPMHSNEICDIWLFKRQE